jgi:hypothetical protein
MGIAMHLLLSWWDRKPTGRRRRTSRHMTLGASRLTSMVTISSAHGREPDH